MAITFKDMKPEVVTVQVELPNGVIEEVQMMPLTWTQWSELGLLVETEKAKKKSIVENGRKKLVDDVREQTQLNALAELKRAKIRLAEALVRGGSAPELADLNHEERVAELDAIDAGIMNALLLALRQTAYGSKASIAEKADRFQ